MCASARGTVKFRLRTKARPEKPRTTTEFIPALQAQLADVTALRDDAAERGWDTEVARHARVITSIQNHLNRLTQKAKPDTTS
jgi:hypothetical protein